MFLKAFLLIALIVLSAIFLITSVIFFVVRISQNHPKKWHWLICIFVGLLVLICSVVFFVTKAVEKATEIGKNMESKFEKTMEQFEELQDSTDFHYNALNTNITIKVLKSYEKADSTAVPEEFYVYFGFRDYYRMPLTYPYALHCVDALEKASLFNEKKVSNFNTSDNGEIDCNLNNITEFAFDDKMLIAKQTEGELGKGNNSYLIFDLKSTATTKCNSEKDAFVKAKKMNYSGPDTLTTVLNYYRRFN
jgi:hypothetical protein